MPSPATGYCRTFGQRLPNGERREWLKPIMFSGGVGQVSWLRSELDIKIIYVYILFYSTAPSNVW